MGNPTANIAFGLLAPRNSYVALAGSWNGGQPLPMQRGEDGRWRAEVALADGDYDYQFELVSNSPALAGQTVRVPDPTAISYTAGGATCLRVRNGKRLLHGYTWRHDAAPLPDNSRLIFYELHIGDFVGGPGDEQAAGRAGTFNDLIERLDYLTELGVNALELMPVVARADEDYWGYKQNSYYAVEEQYGSPDDLCRLIDECHARGIRVFLDAVYNHMNDSAPLTQIDFGYWFYLENPDEPDLQWGPKLNYDHHDKALDIWPACDYTLGAIDLYVRQFHFDGIRFDATRALKSYELMAWMHDEAHKRGDVKPFLTVAEHIPEDPAITRPGGPLDAAWHRAIRSRLVAIALGQEFEECPPYDLAGLVKEMDWRQCGYAAAACMVNYMENHDMERTMFRQFDTAHQTKEVALRRAKLAAALLLTAPGLPLLRMGQELGQATPKSEERSPLDWSLLQQPDNRALFDWYKRLIALRLENPALYSETFEVVHADEEQSVLAFKRWSERGSDKGNVVLVVANLCDEERPGVRISHAALDDGPYSEALNGSPTETGAVVHGHTLTTALARSEVKVFTLRP